MQTLSFTGSNYRLLINSVPFGICTGISYQADVGRRSIFGIDSYLPQELATSQVSINGTIQCIKIKLDGGLEGRGIAFDNREILFEQYIQITILDRQTGSVVFNVNQAAISNQQWRASTGSIVRGSFNFTGISWNQFLSI